MFFFIWNSGTFSELCRSRYVISITPDSFVAICPQWIIRSCRCCVPLILLPSHEFTSEQNLWFLVRPLLFPAACIIVLVGAEFGSLQPFGWWWAGQEGSGFLSVVPPAVSPVFPEGYALIGRGWVVKHWACWEGVAVSWCGVCPASLPSLWSAVARGAAGTLTTLELWLITQRESPKSYLNSLAVTSVWQTDPQIQRAKSHPVFRGASIDWVKIRCQ